MILVVKEFTFDAAHFLPDYDGPCAALHGHSYRLQIGVIGPIQRNGMVMDFTQLKQKVQPLVDMLDHHFLNDVKAKSFPWQMPTAENMVRWIRRQLLSEEFPISFIRLYETPTSYAEWRTGGA